MNYKKYEKYTNEPNVRLIHNRMFDFFARFYPLEDSGLNVIDFGCKTMEFYRYGSRVTNYFGVDKDYIKHPALGIKENYLLKKSPTQNILPWMPININNVCPFKPNSFISLFSSELILPGGHREALSEEIFKQNPSIRTGMVSGIYYKKSNYKKVLPYNGVNIYQSLGDDLLQTSDIFEQYQVAIPTSEDIIEVWKFLVRREF